MLEDYAWAFVAQTEYLTAYVYGLNICGFLIAILLRRPRNKELHRASYFLLSMLLLMATSIANFLWLLTLDAMAAERLWVLLTLIFLSIAVIGYAYGVIAVARSRDAFGHAGYAFLAYVPFACLYLLFKEPLSALDVASPKASKLSSGLVVLLAFVVGGFSFALLNLVERQSRQIEAAAGNDLRIQAIGIQHLLRSKGIEATLKTLSENAPVPMTIDQITVLDRVEANGTRLRRIYIVAKDDFVFTDRFRAFILKNVCSHPPFAPLLSAGADIEEVYSNPQGIAFGSELVNSRTCSLM